MAESTICASDLCVPPPRYTDKERDAESGNDDFVSVRQMILNQRLNTSCDGNKSVMLVVSVQV